MFAAVIFAVLLPRSAFTYHDLAWFVAGLSILKLSDVWLPRGDAVGMSAALALGALLLFDTQFVLAALFIAECLALLPRGRGKKLRSALHALTAEAVAIGVCSSALLAARLHPSVHALTGNLRLRPEQYLLVLLVGVFFAALEHGLLQTEMALRDKRSIAASVLGSLSYGGWLIAAQSSAGVLAALMYRTMGAWGLIVSVIMILVMRQSFVLLLDIRLAYDSTISVLVKAMEAQSPGREGLAARIADISLHVGRALGMHGRELEKVRYAALLLGLGSEQDSCPEGISSTRSSRIIEGVDFLNDVAPILRLCEDPGGAVAVRRADLASSYLVLAVAAQTESVPPIQLERMKERVSPRIVREIDAAVAAAIATVGSSLRCSVGEAE